jgi:hypothetical protein
MNLFDKNNVGKLIRVKNYFYYCNNNGGVGIIDENSLIIFLSYLKNCHDYIIAITKYGIVQIPAKASLYEAI